MSDVQYITPVARISKYLERPAQPKWQDMELHYIPASLDEAKAHEKIYQGDPCHIIDFYA